jgi:hypothetical protein
LITRHNRRTFNRIFGAFRVVSSRVAAALQMTRQRPLFFDQIIESTRIIFGSRLRTAFAADVQRSLLPDDVVWRQAACTWENLRCGLDALPAIIRARGEHTSRAFIEYFTAFFCALKKPTSCAMPTRPQRRNLSSGRRSILVCEYRS